MQELPFLHSARRLMLIDICMKFREDILSGFQVTERTRFVTDRQTDGWTHARAPARLVYYKLTITFGSGELKMEITIANRSAWLKSIDQNACHSAI